MTPSPRMSAPRELLTLEQFATAHPAFPVKTLRWLRFRASDITRQVSDKTSGKSRKVAIPGNGFARAFVKVGGRLLVDVSEFYAAIDRANERDAAA